MQKIKGHLENAIFSLNNPVADHDELRQNLLTMRTLLQEFPVEELEEKVGTLQVERQLYEEKFLKCLETVNIYKHHRYCIYLKHQ